MSKTPKVMGKAIQIDGRDDPVGTPHYDPKKVLAAHGISVTAKHEHSFTYRGGDAKCECGAFLEPDGTIHKNDLATAGGPPDVTVGQLAQTGGLKNPEQAERPKKPKWVKKAYSEGVMEEEYATVSSDGIENPTIINGKPIGAMTDELAVRKVAQIQQGKGPWKPDGDKAPDGGAGGEGEKGEEGSGGNGGSAGIGKSAPAQADQSTPAVTGLTMPAFGYDRMPPQKPLTADQAKRPPKVILAGAPPNATYPHPPIEPFVQRGDGIRKDTMNDWAPTTDWDGQNGRPRWMVSPGYGGKEPVYVSQKPEGNKDTLFAQNINENAPPVQTVDPDAYYIW